MSYKSVFLLTIWFIVASLVGLIHTKQKSENQMQPIELYLIVYHIEGFNITLHFET